MNVEMPELIAVRDSILRLTESFDEIRSSMTPVKEWYNLRECCSVKGVNYNTVKSIRRHQPNQGVEDGIVCGVRMWKKDTVFKWLKQTDADEAV